MSEFKDQEGVLLALLGGKILISNDNWYKIAEGTVMAKAIDGPKKVNNPPLKRWAWSNQKLFHV